jgi:hypothetical protein
MGDSIEKFKERVKEREDVKLGASNSGGYEVKYITEDGREWLLETVDNSPLHFDNRSRIENEHPYTLVLPD